MRASTVHVRDPNHTFDPHELYVSRGADVVFHVTHDGGTTDVWRLTGTEVVSLGVVTGDCGCP